MTDYTHIVWDFNGTLLDDVAACIRAANAILGRHGLNLIRDAEDYRAVFGFPIEDYYRRLGFDFEKTSYAELAVEWVDFYNLYAKNATLFPLVPTLLERSRASGLRQLILSATHLEMLERQVEALGIRDAFDCLLGLDNIHARSKTGLAVSWREQNKEAKVLLIGDTEHDLETAHAMGADCVLLACGHRPEAALRTCGARAVFRDHTELADYLFSLHKAPKT